MTADASTVGCTAIARVGLQLQPQRRQRARWCRCLAAGSSGRPWPIAPARCARRPDRCGSAPDGVELIADGLVDHRLDLRRHVDAGAGHRKAGVAELDLRRQVRLEAPGGGELRPRGDGDVALDLGAGVDRLDVDAADLLGDIAAEQAADGVADRAGRLGGQRARDVELAGERRRPATARPERRSPRSVRARRSSRCRRSAGSATPGCRPCRRNCAARRDRRRRGSR